MYLNVCLNICKNLNKRSLNGVLKGTVESTKMRAHFVESTKCARKSSNEQKRKGNLGPAGWKID